LYNIERENPFEERLLVCKVAKKVLVFPSEWEVWKRFLRSVVSFSNVENLFLSFFESICMYNIERENPFEGRLLVCKVAKRVIVFPSEWEVWKRFLQSVVSFSSVENLFLSFLKVSSFKMKVFGKEFFELLKTSTFKFESVCCSFCVQNVFFSNGVLESHGEV
jgi:hypothetical protein